MNRARGQTVILFALLLLPLIGFLGLALDGGYYFLATRALTMAADSAARAAAVDVQYGQSTNQSSYYTLATSDGMQTGQQNLQDLNLTNIAFTLAYNDTPSASASAAGWYGSARDSTSSVRATATGTYNPLFLQLVGITSVDIQRMGLGATPAVVTLHNILPVAVCQTDRLLTPAGPWILWQSSAVNLCGVLSWYGLVQLNPGPIPCGTYSTWIGPAEAGPSPPPGTLMTVETQSCNGTIWANWQASNGRIAPVLVLDTAAGNKVVGCQPVRLTAIGILGVNSVLGVPVGSMGTCGPQQVN
jgi:Flp pilus assembly protein TadG